MHAFLKGKIGVSAARQGGPGGGLGTSAAESGWGGCGLLTSGKWGVSQGAPLGAFKKTRLLAHASLPCSFPASTRPPRHPGVPCRCQPSVFTEAFFP